MNARRFLRKGFLITAGTLSVGVGVVAVGVPFLILSLPTLEVEAGRGL